MVNFDIQFNMATLFENYEQQYSVLTADITAQIGRLNSADSGIISVLLHNSVVLSLIFVSSCRRS